MQKYQKKIGTMFECTLCPHHCLLGDGDLGRCLARRGSSNGIHLEGYGRITNMCVEPIEKKPIFHFKPGTKVLSIGHYGCPLRCSYCQNKEVSLKKDYKGCKYFSPSAIIHFALKHKCKGICFTYNEPSVYYEFILDLADKCKSRDLYLAINTNAYVEPNPWKDICSVVDVMNIDWKGPPERYREVTKVDAYETVMERINEAVSCETLHVEISVPVYPDFSEEELDCFIDAIPNNDIPIHLLRLFPVDGSDFSTTSKELLFSIYKKLKEYMSFVYIHNLFDNDGKKARDTVCPECEKKIIARGDNIIIRLNKDCKVCKKSFVI